jgi:hypothetical protein
MNRDQPQPSRAWRTTWVVCLLASLATLGLVVGRSPAATRQTPDCVQFWPEARYRDYAYDHIVHVLNACHALAICMVSSDLDPAPVRSEVKAGENSEVLLTRGSPANQFTPKVECGLVL